MMHTLSIIVISYNTCEMTLECIHSIFSNTRLNQNEFEVIVFDNASDDDSANKIEREFGDKVTLIRSNENIGFAAGNNLAAQNITSEYILFLNPDTLILDNAIDRLILFSKSNPTACLWGGRTLFSDLTLNPGSCWSQQTIWSLTCQMFGLSSLFRKSTLFNPEGIGGWDREGERYVDIISGCFLLIKSDLWVKLNGFCPDYFMYGEDADLCLRAIKLGAKPMDTSSATIIHYGGASEIIRADKLVRLLTAKQQLIHDHFMSVLIWPGTMLLTAWPFTRCLAHKFLTLFGREKSRVSATVWCEVWRRRSEWL